jgi:chromosome segregation ATPase
MIQATKQRITALRTKRSEVLNKVQTGDSRIEDLQKQVTMLQNQVLTIHNEMKELKRIKAEDGNLADIDWEISEEMNTLKRLEHKDHIE